MLPYGASSSGDEPAPAPRRRPGAGAVVAIVLLALACSAALSVNVVRATYSPKGDESTYVAMAISLAYDHNMSFDRTDLEQFYRFYRGGPEGIFLKRGTEIRLHFTGRWPFVQIVHPPDPANRLYFGKAFIYPLAVAPFVWLFGLNGMLLFHVLLLAGVCVCGYYFLAARSPGPAALLFALGFVGASIVPIYALWLTSEMFNFSAVFFAYFLWFYKEVAPPRPGRWAAFLRGPNSDLLAAVLLGLATFSKPTNALLATPVVLLLWTRRRWIRGFLVGALFVAVTSACFGVNALVTGEFNYQGGDRRTFYGTFPDQNPSATFDRTGISMSTNSADTQQVVETPKFWPQLARNAGYFLVGRDAGFMPYYFPGLVVIVLWAMAGRERRLWHLFVLLTVAASAVIILIYLPYTWGGGGGPPGNRYFLSLYPALFFMTPPLASVVPALAAWVGGAAFIAQILVNPFVASKYVYQFPDHGLLRLLPVELTMVNDLPINLDRSRSHLFYSTSPTILLYLLDQNAYPPEVGGIWVAGQARADIIVRTDRPIARLGVQLSAPIANRVTLTLNGASSVSAIKAGVPATVWLSAPGVYAHRSDSYLLSVSTTNGFVPALTDPTSTDPRYLGVFLTLTADLVPAPEGAPRGGP